MAPAVERTVLVVDHDPILLRTLVRALERGGYSVLAAPNGQAALAVARSTEVGVVIADVPLPDMSGSDLAEELHCRCPSLHVGLITRSSPDELAVDHDATEALYPPSRIVELAGALLG